MPKKPNTPKQARAKALLITATETEAGLQWLNSLTEDQVRDRVLVELFRRMQADRAISGFENIHGRNDKGVDFIVSVSSAFGSSLLGVQVKSKPISKPDAVQIRSECHSALLHDFHFDGRTVRLDAIELWSSSPMTEDADKEMNPPHTPVRVGVKKEREILVLIEKHCPALLSKVPQFAVAKYLSDSKSPPPKAMRVLGCQLNPRTHFIEPYFSARASTSLKTVKQKNGVLTKQQEKLSVQSLLEENSHSVVFAPPLSGRTYLLEHLKTRLAEVGHVPVLLKAAEFPKGDLKLDSVIAHHLGFLTARQVQELRATVGFVILIDDADKLAAEAREKLFAHQDKGIRVIGTARTLVVPPSVKEFHLIGVDWNNIVRFLRALDSPLAAGKPFVDRARKFIERAFEASGLPKNPFTIAVMLEECQHSTNRFSTPTMGRLIGRFIELQLGSHIETGFLVDFETKREFLTRLAGHARSSFSSPIRNGQ